MLEYIEDIIGTSILEEPIRIYNERLTKLKDYEGFLVISNAHIRLGNYLSI